MDARIKSGHDDGEVMDPSIVLIDAAAFFMKRGGIVVYDAARSFPKEPNVADAARSIASDPLFAALSAPARLAPESGIVEVMNYGRRAGRAVMPLWAGEGDLPTPDFITDAAAEGLATRRDVLHLAARHPGLARRARALSHAALREALRARAILHHGLGHAGDPDRARDGGAGRRRNADPDADVAECGRRDRRHRRPRGRSADDVRQCGLDARLRAYRERDHAEDAGAVPGLAIQPDRLDRDTRRSQAHARAGAPARPVDRRRRDLCALLVWRWRRGRRPIST